MNLRRAFSRALTAALLGVALLLPASSQAQITPLTAPDLPETIPLFPLPNVAVLPYLELPLHVFEPRYREMLADTMAGNRGDRHRPASARVRGRLSGKAAHLWHRVRGRRRAL
jgi:hypothetical protein